jgi:hypothetical protein
MQARRIVTLRARLAEFDNALTDKQAEQRCLVQPRDRTG